MSKNNINEIDEISKRLDELSNLSYNNRFKLEYEEDLDLNLNNLKEKLELYDKKYFKNSPKIIKKIKDKGYNNLENFLNTFEDYKNLNPYFLQIEFYNFFHKKYYKSYKEYFKDSNKIILLKDLIIKELDEFYIKNLNRINFSENLLRN
jgi:hypothetical protein